MGFKNVCKSSIPAYDLIFDNEIRLICIFLSGMLIAQFSKKLLQIGLGIGGSITAFGVSSRNLSAEMVRFDK